ncbi:hypothetical protein Aca07nite_68440 [Actinoplanes capillaceus]|uniref:CsbD-like domain-containing protein n=2 Tax=Actinoplanes campanulatus TaxID=113559 RepID=A0ABQ3WTH3_9ACTN|nr:hypothetical protein Aca07nite_68440 [Actinoplanes capillaceus]
MPAKCFVSPDVGKPGTAPLLSEMSSADEVRVRARERSVMGLDDKIENKTQEAAGKAKQNIGEATDDQDLQAEGKADQRSSNIKQAGEKIKNAFKK